MARHLWMLETLHIVDIVDNTITVLKKNVSDWKTGLLSNNAWGVFPCVSFSACSYKAKGHSM